MKVLHRRSWIWLLAALLLAVAPLAASENKTRAGKGPVGTIIEPAAVAAGVEKLSRDLVWHPTLALAREQAAREGKMILWLHALGDLTGST